MSPIFYLMAALTAGGAVAAMTLRHPVHCALSLVLTFAGLAGIYLGLGAQFLGLAQVLVYIGAVAILLVFVLLLTRSAGIEGETRGWSGWRSGLVAAVAVVGLLVAAVLGGPDLAMRPSPPQPPTVREIGEALMTEFVLPLEVMGVLLTAAMIGAAILALRERPPRGSYGGRSG